MPYYIISDAHETGGDARDYSACNPRFALDLKGFVAMADDNPIIRLGDWYDFWRGRRGRVAGCESGAEHLWAGRKRDVRLEGNHDPGTGPVSLMLNVGGKRFLFHHGTRLDAANSGVRRIIGWLATKIAALVMDWNGSPIWPTGETVDERLFRLIGHAPDDARFEAAAERYRQLMGADFIVCGHTHRMAVKERYANSGRWPQYLVIEDDGRVHAETWKGGALKPSGWGIAPAKSPPRKPLRPQGL